jgi:hypothetical protein
MEGSRDYRCNRINGRIYAVAAVLDLWGALPRLILTFPAFSSLPISTHLTFELQY